MPKCTIISAHCKDEREFTEFPNVLLRLDFSKSKSGTHVLTAVTKVVAVNIVNIEFYRENIYRNENGECHQLCPINSECLYRNQLKHEK